MRDEPRPSISASPAARFTDAALALNCVCILVSEKSTIPSTLIRDVWERHGAREFDSKGGEV